MKRLAVFSLVLLLMAGVVYAKDFEVKKKAGDYDVEIRIDKNPPVVGENNIEIEIKDASGKYVTDAVVAVESSMPTMGSMPGHSSKVSTVLKGDKYLGKIQLTMGGAWKITVEISRAGKKSKVSFNVDAN